MHDYGKIRQALEGLTDQQRRTLQLSIDHPELTLGQLGRLLGVSGARVGQLLDAVARKCEVSRAQLPALQPLIAELWGAPDPGQVEDDPLPVVEGELVEEPPPDEPKPGRGLVPPPHPPEPIPDPTRRERVEKWIQTHLLETLGLLLALPLLLAGLAFWVGRTTVAPTEVIRQAPTSPPQPTPQVLPTYTPAPTYTPLPTYTAQPAQIVMLTPTPPPGTPTTLPPTRTTTPPTQTPSPPTATPAPLSPMRARFSKFERRGYCDWIIEIEISGVRPGAGVFGANYLESKECGTGRRSIYSVGYQGAYPWGVADRHGKVIGIHPQGDYGWYKKEVWDEDGNRTSIEYTTSMEDPMGPRR